MKHEGHVDMYDINSKLVEKQARQEKPVKDKTEDLSSCANSWAKTVLNLPGKLLLEWLKKEVDDNLRPGEFLSAAYAKKG